MPTGPNHGSELISGCPLRLAPPPPPPDAEGRCLPRSPMNSKKRRSGVIIFRCADVHCTGINNKIKHDSQAVVMIRDERYPCLHKDRACIRKLKTMRVCNQHERCRPPGPWLNYQIAEMLTNRSVGAWNINWLQSIESITLLLAHSSKFRLHAIFAQLWKHASD